MAIESDNTFHILFINVNKWIWDQLIYDLRIQTVT